MTVYNVSGTIAVLVSSKDRGWEVLQEKARSAEMDVFDVQVVDDSSGPGCVASGVLAGLFEADSEKAATGRFADRVFRRSGSLPKNIVVLPSEDVPKEWVK